MIEPRFAIGSAADRASAPFDFICPSPFLPALRDSLPMSANALVHLHSTSLSHRHFFDLRSNRFPPLDSGLVANFSIRICVSEVCVLEQIHNATSHQRIPWEKSMNRLKARGEG